MSETTSTTTDEFDEDTEPVVADATPEQPAAPTPDAEPIPAENESKEDKPKRSLGLRKPSGAARGAMAATAMAAVPATGVVGSVVYGNFGAAGLAATAATGLAAGGVALAVRAKRRAEERAKTKDSKDGKAGLPPHPLSGLKRLLGNAKEKAAQRRAEMAERRAGRGGLAGTRGTGVAGAGRRLRDAIGGTAGRGRQAAGQVAGGRGRSAAAAGASHGRTGRAASQLGAAGRFAGGRHAVPGGRAAAGRGVAGTGRGPAGGGRGASGGRGAGQHGPRGGGANAGRYVNPTTGRPMTPRQVAQAVRQQNRAQRIVAGNSYPRRAGRWAWRHRRVAGIGMAAVSAVAAAALAVPVIAAAGVGLGVFGVARHPAFRRVLRGCVREARQRAGRFGRWLDGQWALWRRRRAARVPVDGELLDEPIVQKPAPDTLPVWDAEVVPQPEHAISAGTPAGPSKEKPSAAPPTEPRSKEAPREAPNASRPASGAWDDTGDWESEQRERHWAGQRFAQEHYGPSFDADHEDGHTTRWVSSERADRRQQLALTNRSESSITQENTMRIFDTLTESIGGLPGLSLGPGEGGGHDVERWAESLADAIDALGERINSDAGGIIERFPMDSAGGESMSQLAAAFSGIASQVREHVEQWKSDASWQYTDNNA